MLTAKEVRIVSTLKLFDREKSDGSEVEITFTVEPGTDPVVLRDEIVHQKGRLDLLVLALEAAKGVMSSGMLEERRNAIKANLQKLTK